MATATLIRAVKDGIVEKDDCIMLNITGGGEKRFKKEKEVVYLKPSHIFEINPPLAEIKKVMDKLFYNYSEQ